MAFSLYKKAAELGFSTSQHNLALCYLNGNGTTKDPAKALYYWEKAALSGNQEAQKIVALLYFNGIGVSKNLVESYAYFSLATVPQEALFVPTDYLQRAMETRQNIKALEKEMSPEQIEAAKERADALDSEIQSNVQAIKDNDKMAQRNKMKAGAISGK